MTSTLKIKLLNPLDSKSPPDSAPGDDFPRSLKPLTPRLILGRMPLKYP